MKSSNPENITAVFILEVIGRPPEHLTETLNDLIKKIDEEKGIHVLSKKVNEPVPMKDQKEFYTSFAEIEVSVDELIYLMILIFKYMPAHLEIISPENMQLTNTDINDLLNELVRRLHGYDEIARIIQNEKFVLEKKLREVLEGKPIQDENALLSVKPKEENAPISAKPKEERKTKTKKK